MTVRARRFAFSSVKAQRGALHQIPILGRIRMLADYVKHDGTPNKQAGARSISQAPEAKTELTTI
ncbi:hypothetical protein [Phyllobacterium sophorae]|uniref:hypothetical protein n=1 Tax=Phyllobacterium sophorae TaxID=1520277 RepID=UPI0011B26046|nr:hypothetical protein [Phyllobacterium sophorae]